MVASRAYDVVFSTSHLIATFLRADSPFLGCNEQIALSSEPPVPYENQGKYRIFRGTQLPGLGSCNTAL